MNLSDYDLFQNRESRHAGHEKAEQKINHTISNK